MSIVKEIIIQVKCDKCGKRHPITGDSVRDTRNFAREAGWKLGKQKDFCKECAEQIKTAVKEAQAGNLP